MIPGSLWLLVAAACGPVDPSALQPLPEPDRLLFDRVVSPILEQRCGEGSCHGDSARPFNLYAPGRRRLEGVPTFSRQPLSAEELSANFVASLGFIDHEIPTQTTLLNKALSPGGPEAHGGGAVFTGIHDPECRAVVEWLGGER